MIALIEHDCILPSITAALSPCSPHPQSRVKSLFDASSLLDPRLRPAHCFQFTVPAPDSVFEVNEQLFFTLSQVDDRSPLSPGHLDVGLVLYRIERGGRLTEIAFQKGVSVSATTESSSSRPAPSSSRV
jgi:hypothetical protein